jgi:hypothetical protein
MPYSYLQKLTNAKTTLAAVTESARLWKQAAEHRLDCLKDIHRGLADAVDELSLRGAQIDVRGVVAAEHSTTDDMSSGTQVKNETIAMMSVVTSWVERLLLQNSAIEDAIDEIEQLQAAALAASTLPTTDFVARGVGEASTSFRRPTPARLVPPLPAPDEDDSESEADDGHTAPQTPASSRALTLRPPSMID